MANVSNKNLSFHSVHYRWNLYVIQDETTLHKAANIRCVNIVEALGYMCRFISSTETPDWTMKPYIGKSLMLLLAPALFAASVYVILGRIIRLLNAGSVCLIRPSWLTKIFVTGDVLSFLIQSGGMWTVKISVECELEG